MANYRPVFNLTFVSKVTEQTVASQNEYLVANDLSPRYLSAYRKRHGHATCLVGHTDVQPPTDDWPS